MKQPVNPSDNPRPLPACAAGKLALPVGEFLALSHKTVWSSLPAHTLMKPGTPRSGSVATTAEGEAPPHEMTQRDVMLQRNTASQPAPGFRRWLLRSAS